MIDGLSGEKGREKERAITLNRGRRYGLQPSVLFVPMRVLINVVAALITAAASLISSVILDFPSGSARLINRTEIPSNLSFVRLKRSLRVMDIVRYRRSPSARLRLARRRIKTIKTDIIIFKSRQYDILGLIAYEINIA